MGPFSVCVSLRLLYDILDFCYAIQEICGNNKNIFDVGTFNVPIYNLFYNSDYIWYFYHDETRISLLFK